MEDCDTGYAATAAASRSGGSKSVLPDKIKEPLLPTSARCQDGMGAIVTGTGKILVLPSLVLRTFVSLHQAIQGVSLMETESGFDNPSLTSQNVAPIQR
jgi:hypothetical protein